MTEFSKADELTKLADLRDRGLITQSDFDNQKDQLLGNRGGSKTGLTAGLVIAVVLVLVAGGVLVATRHNGQAAQVSNAEAHLGTGSTGSSTAGQLSITSLPAAGGKGGDPGDDYPYKGLAKDARLDPWREWVRECTSFAAWALDSRNGFTMPFYGDALTWGPQARARGFVVNATPAPGAIAWESPGDHVAWVSSVNGSSFTIEEYNEHGNGTYDARTLSSRGSFLFIHFKDLPTIQPAPTQQPVTQPAPSPQPTASGGSSSSGGGVAGTGSVSGTGAVSGTGSVAGSGGLQGAGSVASGGSPAPSPSPHPTPTPTPTTTTTAPTPTPTTAPPTYTEYAGGVSHTWTNYTNAGGTEGPSIPASTPVQISCKIAGFRVQDGDTWWYRIAQSPWSNSFYVSADAFYNNGATSGSLIGTPFVDPAVPNC